MFNWDTYRLFRSISCKYVVRPNEHTKAYPPSAYSSYNEAGHEVKIEIQQTEIDFNRGAVWLHICLLLTFIWAMQHTYMIQSCTRPRIPGPLKNHKLPILLIIYRILPLNHRPYSHFSCSTLLFFCFVLLAITLLSMLLFLVIVGIYGMWNSSMCLLPFLFSLCCFFFVAHS